MHRHLRPLAVRSGVCGNGLADEHLKHVAPLNKLLEYFVALLSASMLVGSHPIAQPCQPLLH